MKPPIILGSQIKNFYQIQNLTAFDKKKYQELLTDSYNVEIIGDIKIKKKF